MLHFFQHTHTTSFTSSNFFYPGHFSLNYCLSSSKQLHTGERKFSTSAEAVARQRRLKEGDEDQEDDDLGDARKNNNSVKKNKKILDVKTTENKKKKEEK